MSGIEAIGAIAGIAQLLDVGIRTSRIIIDLYEGVKKGSEKTDNRLQTLLQLQLILADLAIEQNLNTPLMKHSIQQMVRKLLQLEGILQKFKQRLSRKQRNIFSCIQNHLEEPKVQDILDDLERDKTTFLMLLGHVNAKLQERLYYKLSKPSLVAGTSSRQDGTTCNAFAHTAKSVLCNLPSTHVPQFIGQKDHLSSLNTVLHQAEQNKRAFVITGTAGSGKTQLAIKFCRDQYLNGTSIFWIECSSHQQIRHSFSSLARTIQTGSSCNNECMQPEQCIKYVKDFLSTTTTQWIMVFDNWDDMEALPELSTLTPDLHQGFILVTSRHPDVVRLGPCLELNGMKDEDGVELLFANIEANGQSNLQPIGYQIVRRLGHLPLAIDQAASYIRSMGIPVQQFLQHYETRMHHILDHVPAAWEYRKRILPEETLSAVGAFTTWELIFTAFAKKHSIAAKFLRILGFLCSISVDEAIFQTVLNTHTRTGTTSAPSSTTESLLCTLECFRDEDGYWDSCTFATVVKLLKDERLVEACSMNAAGTLMVSLHPLISDWLKVRQSKQQSAVLFRQACDAIRCMIETKKLEEDCSLDMWQGLVAHVDSLLAHRTLLLAMPDHVLLITLSNFSDFYFRRGRYASAVEAYDMLISLLDAVNDTKSLQRFEALCGIARSHHCLGKYELAEQTAQKAVNGLTEVAGDNAPATIAAKETLANIYRSRAAYCEAEKIYLHIIQRQNQVLSELDEQILSVVANLAVVYRSQGKMPEAREIYQDFESWLWTGSQKPCFNLIWIRNDYATFLQSQGHLAEAQAIYQAVLLSRKNHLGWRHHDTLWTLVDVANNLKLQEKYDEAQKIYEEAFTLLKEVLGERHPETLWAADGLGDLYARMRNLDQAEHILSWALRSRAQCLGASHHNTLRTLRNIANVYRLQDRLEESKISYEIALEGLTQRLGAHHPKTEDVKRKLTAVVEAQESAEGCTKESLQSIQLVESG